MWRNQARIRVWFVKVQSVRKVDNKVAFTKSWTWGKNLLLKMHVFQNRDNSPNLALAFCETFTPTHTPLLENFQQPSCLLCDLSAFIQQCAEIFSHTKSLKSPNCYNLWSRSLKCIIYCRETWGIYEIQFGVTLKQFNFGYILYLRYSLVLSLLRRRRNFPYTKLDLTIKTNKLRKFTAHPHPIYGAFRGLLLYPLTFVRLNLET